jgi:S1-C subfamily serine protease
MTGSINTGGTTTASGLLQQFSDELAGAVERAGASVVRVSARRRLPGTGIVWAATEGGYTIVTANHIVERDEDITVTDGQGRELPATLLGRDQGSDIALLNVADTQLTPATRAEVEQARVGVFALALGRAGQLAATSGVVSALAGPGHGGHGGRGGNGGHGGRGRRFERLIATDATMFPGFSGGPLIDASGRVLGMLSSHLGRGQTLAIPAADVERIATALQAHGKVRRGYLGVGAQQAQLPASLKQAHGIEQELGLLLVSVDEAGPAGQAGLTIGDIILTIGGQPVQGLDDLRGAIGAETVGTPVTARVLRGGEPRDVTITVGEQGSKH